MKNNYTPIIKLGRLALLIGSVITLVSALYQLSRNLPDLRYAWLFALAMMVSWPRLRLPINTAELLFFVVLLVYGSPAALLLATMASIVTWRSLFPEQTSLYLAKVGKSCLSAWLAGVILNWLVQKSALLVAIENPILLINALAWMAWTRYLLQADWGAAITALRRHNWREKLLNGQWVNEFVTYFAAAIGASVVFLVSLSQSSHVTLLSLILLPIFYFSYRRFKKRYIDSEEVARLHLRTIETLAGAIEAQDRRAQTHTQRLQIYIEGLGRALGLSESDLKGLSAAALLRDIGKLAVPDYILNKSGDLTEAEMDKFKSHPVVGAKLLEQIGYPYPIVPAVKHHHEHWDGSGYPDHLSGEAIPLEARILAIVDDFDTVFGDGSNKYARDEAISLLLNESGQKYDPQIVQIFLEQLPVFEAEIARLHPLPPYLLGSNGTPHSELATIETSAMDHWHSLKEIRRAHMEGTELLNLAQTLSSTLNLEEAVAIILSRLSRLIPFETAAIYLCDESYQLAYVAGAVGPLADKLRDHEIRIGQGVIGNALATGQAGAAELAPDEFPGLPTELRQKIKAMAVYPLIKGERIIGSMVLLSPLPNAFGGEQQRVLAMVEPLAADAIYNSMTYLRTEARALTDALTGLPNSRALVNCFEQESNRADRYGTSLAMLMIDLDGFKQVNDTFGHQVGDLVLCEVANCLKKELRAGDPLIRYAGDEFIALLPYAEERSIKDLINRIQKYLEAYSIQLSETEVKIGASIGYAIYHRDGVTLDDLLRVADEGMYRNKAMRKRPSQSKPFNMVTQSSPASEEVGMIFTEAIAS